MYRTLLSLFALLAMGAALAQPPAPQPPYPLKLSQAMVVMKISDLPKQITAFAPLFTRVNTLIKNVSTANNANQAAPDVDITAALSTGVNQLSLIPGLDIHGTIWFVVMAPSAEAMQAMMEGAMSGDKQDPSAMLKIYQPTVLIPITDAATFQGVLDGMKAEHQAPFSAKICGNFAMLTFEKEPSKYTDVQFDIPLLTNRDIVCAYQLKNTHYVDIMAENMPPIFAPIAAPLLELMKEQKANVERSEVGLAMIGDMLSAESYIVPMPGSPLADNITAQGNAPDVALQLAGYLPESLACCKASGPALPGLPDPAQTIAKFGVRTLALFDSPQLSAPFILGTKQLMSQCSHGRAVGVTNPTTGQPSTIVAIYTVADTHDARAAMKAMVTGFDKFRDGIIGGVFSGTVKLYAKYDLYTIGDTPVDLLKVVMKAPEPKTPETKDAAAQPRSSTPKPKSASQPYTLEMRTAFLGNKMVVAIGTSGKAALETVVTNIQQQKAGFGATDRFKALQKSLPAHTLAFGSLSPADCLHMITSFLPEKEKSMGDKLLASLPPQHGVISAYLEARDGNLRGEVRIPGEQIDYFFKLVETAIKTGMQQKAATSKPGAAPGKTTAPGGITW